MGVDHTWIRSQTTIQSPDSPEEFRITPDELEQALSAAPVRGVPKPLFIAVAALAAVLGILLAWLAVCTWGSAQQESELQSRLARQESAALQLSAWSAAVRASIISSRSPSSTAASLASETPAR